MPNLRTDLRTALTTTNHSLKLGGMRCSISERNNLFYLQATLPPRSGEGPPRQQKIALGRCGLAHAKTKAMLLGAQLQADSFDWLDWTEGPTSAVITVADFRTAARERYELTYTQEASWKSIWTAALNLLPKNDKTPLTINLITTCLSAAPKNSCAKRDQGIALYLTARHLEMEDWEKIKNESKGYGRRDLVTRDIPSDQFYEEGIDLMTSAIYHWCVGCLITYGLRPHELAEGYVNEAGKFEVHWDTKTGERSVEPCHSRWVKQWKLRDRPELITVKGNLLTKDTIGYTIRDRLRRIPGIGDHQKATKGVNAYAGMLKLYNMRHAYARRLIFKNVPINIAAALMGHTVKIHMERYQRWFQIVEHQKISEIYGL